MSNAPTRFPEVPLKRLAAIPIRNGLGEAASAGDDLWPRYVRITDIADLFTLYSDKRVTMAPDVAQEAPVQRGDLLLAAVGATVGTAHLYSSDDAACYAGYLVRFRGDETKCNRRFIAHWTQSTHFTDQIASGAVQSTIQNYSASRFAATTVPLPPLREQHDIADFLDRETAQIDAAIDAQKRLVTLLEERRGAVVLELLTAGRDPWIFRGSPGTTLLKRVVEMSSGESRPELEADGPYQVIGAGKPVGLTSQWNAAPGDIAVGRVGSVGSVHLLVDRSWVTDNAIHLRVRRSKALPSFISYYLSAMDLSQLTSTTAQPLLTSSRLGGVPISVPELAQQETAVDALDKTTSRNDAMISKAQESIVLMRERRAALISAAVTGRINVETGAEWGERELEEARA